MITKEQWTAIETTLTGAFGRVELLIDGFNVVLRIERLKELKFGIMTYVNGEFRGTWMKEDSEIGMRFYRPVSKFMHDAKYRAQVIKIYGGKRCPKAKIEEINKKLVLRDPIWSNAKTLHRHFVKHNKELSLVKIGY